MEKRIKIPIVKETLVNNIGKNVRLALTRNHDTIFKPDRFNKLGNPLFFCKIIKVQNQHLICKKIDGSDQFDLTEYFLVNLDDIYSCKVL